MKQIIHRLLECRRGVGEAERHDTKLIMVVNGTECRLVDIGRGYTYVMVAGHKVNFGKYSRPMKFIQEFINS